ncbi:hypothetical protein SLE2022_211950 [Rubroshorea leprosula]
MADEEEKKEIHISIFKKLEKLHSAILPKQKIFRLSRDVLEVNKKAYEPYSVSIGPYHYGEEHLKKMEMHKVRFLRMLLDRNGIELGIYVDEVRGIAQEARDYYSQLSLNISIEEFSEMMVLDGCFIVELIHQLREKKLDPSVFKGGLVLRSILRDLALVENQLPFCVLWKLLDITVKEKKGEYIKSLLQLFEYTMRGLRVNEIGGSVEGFNHLLHLLQSIWSPPFQKMDQVSRLDDFKWSFMHSASELSEAGIQFVNKFEAGSLFDIEFRSGKGILEIPTMIIDDSTESFYHNIIAFEQYSKDGGYLTSYCRLMDCLINSDKDVELLRRCGIIVNYLGNDQAVATMFNKLGVQVGIFGNDFFYDSLFRSVNEYYDRTWNKWKATLRRDYCNSPWASISVVAAVFLLLLTLLQTIFTVFPSAP